MPVHRQRKPSETIVSTGNEEKITLDDVLKTWGPRINELSSPVPYTETAAGIAAALVTLGLMLPEPEGE